ncbi:GNAT family N-acetyltransferase [uncultured Shewanella sp.]|uniref:GNAT family N-acetyltransferase n=1 Tax=Shewanella atlantica TaxID=271099 RepID=UPI002611AB4A|nr:GNAT family N-acetyltransferase [uncultured Shewanella sp.]
MEMETEETKIETETERLLFRRFSLDDVAGFYGLNLDPLVLKFTGDKPFSSRSEVVRFIEEYDQYDKYGFGRWSLYLKSSGEYIGFCGLRQSPETGEVDIGFRLMRRFWHRGYALESAKASLELAFTRYGVDTVIARAMKNNLASQRLIQKLGMQLDSSFIESGEEWLKYELKQERWLLNNQEGEG